MGIENDLVYSLGRNLLDFVSGHRNRPDIRVETEVDLIPVKGSKLSRFLCVGSKSTSL